jgi:hypothetical protein
MSYGLLALLRLKLVGWRSDKIGRVERRVKAASEKRSTIRIHGLSRYGVHFLGPQVAIGWGREKQGRRGQLYLTHRNGIRHAGGLTVQIYGFFFSFRSRRSSWSRGTAVFYPIS